MGLDAVAVGRPVKVCFYYSTWPAAPHTPTLPCIPPLHDCIVCVCVCKTQSQGACMHERPPLLLISSCLWTHQKQSLPPPRDMPPAAVQCLWAACHYSWPYSNEGGVAMKGLVAGQKLGWREHSHSTFKGFPPSAVCRSFNSLYLTSRGTTKSVFTHRIIHAFSPVGRDHLNAVNLWRFCSLCFIHPRTTGMCENKMNTHLSVKLNE